MAYRRPGVTVTQEFIGLVPALAAFSLPCVAVGAAYQLVNGDALGPYAAVETAYAYASLLGGAAVDTDLADPNELYPATKQPISVTLKNAVGLVLVQQATGDWNGTTFTDPTTSQFADVVAGDILVVTPTTGLTIVAAQTNGATSNTSGLRDRLTAGTPGQFAAVQVGDAVVVTAGANTTTGTYPVTAKSGDTLIFATNVNDGVGVSTDVAYHITGDRGVASAGNYTVKSKTDDNTLVLQSVLPAVELPITYEIRRKLGTLSVPRFASPDPSGFTADDVAITLPVSLVMADAPFLNIISGDVFADYRALRGDLAAEVKPYNNIADITAVFGLNQFTPANPLAYALEVMLQNTVTTVNGLGLDASAHSDEVLSFTNSVAALATTQMYAIAVLSQNPVVHTLMKTHVVGFSDPTLGLERVCLVNSKLISRAVLETEATTVTTVPSSRIIVNTQLDGAGVFASPATLNDSSPSNPFLNVQPGDLVVIQGGTNVTPGNYPVLTHLSNTQLLLSGNFITSGSPTDIQYYIVRRDGLGADGKTFYDRNATFLSNGVAAGHYLEILSGALKGRYKIATVPSDKSVVLGTAVAGVATLKTALDYQIDRDLSKDEQAALVGGYSASFASRRVVHCWPDTVAVPIGQVLADVPGFYLCATVAALTAGLPTQQGFTNLSVSGFLDLKHSSRYFTDAQLNVIADGGTMIFAQDGPQQPLYCRHQLTTDRSAIKFQEFSVTKNVDFIAKFTRSAYRGFPGVYNIVDTTLDSLKLTATGVIKFLKEDTIRPKIGGVIRSGSLTSIAEDPTQIDTVKIRFGFNIPIPLNNIDITIQV